MLDEQFSQAFNAIYRKNDPLVIAVLGEKGGIGKTTLSVNLAVAFACHGFRVGIIDTDVSQRSSATWCRNRQDKGRSPKIEFEIKKVADLHQSSLLLRGSRHIILIDTPGSDINAAGLLSSLVNIFLLPTQSGQFDMERTVPMIASLEAIKNTNYGVVYNRGRRPSKSRMERVVALKNAFENPMHESVAFQDANELSLGLTEYVEYSSTKQSFQSLVKEIIVRAVVKENFRG